jgi:cell division protein FtsL
MLPVSLGHIPPVSGAGHEADDGAAWFRPANVAAAKNTERRALIGWLAVFVFLGVVIALGHVWLRLKVVDLGYQLLTTRQLIEKLAQEQHELTIEVATLDAPARLEEVARARLGMGWPERGQEAALP